jgi:indolepyruvate ferredoxin oxidoreductase beta subunit
MKQQIVISGLGGQGALTLTRLLAEAAMALGLPVITSETHGMAQRGGTVISMVKVGPFKGPLIPLGEADVGLFLHAGNLPVHRPYLKEGGLLLVNTPAQGDYLALNALSLARTNGLAPVAANLILLGYAAGKRALFADAGVFEGIIGKISPPKFLEANLKAFRLGMEAAGLA